MSILEQITPEIKEDMIKIHFVSDLHFNHDKIISICNRPCTIEEHENWLINQINSNVGKKHRLYILGDISMVNKQRTELFIDKLNGVKHLILGNHDKNIEKSTRFESISQIKDFTYPNYNMNIHIVLCHYCLLSWNRSHHGSFHLFGHSHCRPLQGQSNLSFDVGIDRIGIWRPYNLYEICKIMDMKQQNYSEEDILKQI